MSLLRSVPMGAACVLCTTWLLATPSVESPAAAVALREAVQSVWRASPELQAAAAGRDALRARARAAARPLYNPELVLDAENADVDRRVVGIGLTLDLSGKRRARTAQGEAAAQAGEAGYALRRNEVAARWLKAWSAQALAQRQVELGRQRLALMRRFDALAARRLRAGDVSGPERDLAALALGEAQLQQAALVGREAAARAALHAIAGTPASLPAMPGQLPPAAGRLPARDPGALPELQQARAEQQEAAAGVRVARRARVPDPRVSLTGGEVRSGPRRDRVLGLSVSIPLPVLNDGSAEVAAALAEEDAAAARRRARELAQHANLSESSARYAALSEAAAAFRRGRAGGAFAERTALLEKLWRAGEIGTSDYLLQLKQSLDTALSGLDLESQAWQAWFDYLSAAGRLTDWIDGHYQDAAR